MDQAKCLLDKFLSTPFDANEFLMAQTDITKWGLSLGEEQPVALRVVCLCLSKQTSSAFIERLFSSGSIVWNSKTSRMKPDTAEKKIILRQSRKLMAHLEKLVLESSAGLV